MAVWSSKSGGLLGRSCSAPPPALNGVEIDLNPDDATLPHTHSAVRERQLVNGVSYAAVYPKLKEGLYTVEGSGQRVLIIGGRVTEIEFEIS